MRIAAFVFSVCISFPSYGQFNIFVDSASGSDSNSGTSAAIPLQSLTAASHAAIAHGNGVTIGLKRGSYWRQPLALPTLNGWSVGCYGAIGDPPIIDAADVLKGFTKANGFLNLYVATSSAATAEGINGVLGSHYYRVWQNGNEMLLAASATAADAKPGYAFTDLTGANPVVYVYPTRGQNPSTSGDLFELNTILNPLDAASNSDNQINNTVSGCIEVKRALTNDGSAKFGPNGTVTGLLAEDGGKHNMLQASGTLTDSVLYGVSPNVTDTTSAMFVAFYDPTQEPLGSALPMTLTRTFFIANPAEITAGTQNTWALLNHAVNGGTLSQGIVEQTAFLNIKSSGALVGNNPTIFRGLYFYHTLPPNNSGGAYAANNIQVNGIGNPNNGWAGSGSSKVNTISNLASYMGYAIWSTANYVTLTNSALVNVGNTGSNMQGSVTNFTSHYNLMFIVAGATGPYQNVYVDTATYTGDHNIYYRDGNRQVYARNASGTLFSTLAGWQVASGQDAHSVYLTDAQYKVFFLGSVAEGDFRINPNAQVTGSNGAVYQGTFPDGLPITNAGPQTHWDWNIRGSVFGPPLWWPRVPNDLNTARQYILNPATWDFTPSNTGAVANAGSFKSNIAPGTWIAIFGADLASLTYSWQTADFLNGQLPISLQGVSVTINGKPAYVAYVSPTQINVLAPDDTAVGPVNVAVTVNQQTRNIAGAQMENFSPAFFTTDGTTVAALHTDYSLISAARPARPGEVILLYGTGFGQTNPITDVGRLITAPASLNNAVQISFGGTTANVSFAGIVQSGLAQFNVTVPANVSGNVAVIASIGGTQTQSGVSIPIER